MSCFTLLLALSSTVKQILEVLSDDTRHRDNFVFTSPSQMLGVGTKFHNPNQSFGCALISCPICSAPNFIPLYFALHLFWEIFFSLNFDPTFPASTPPPFTCYKVLALSFPFFTHYQYRGRRKGKEREWGGWEAQWEIGLGHTCQLLCKNNIKFVSLVNCNGAVKFCSHLTS